MYKKFYGLKRNPFELSPDPRFYYPTPRHNEAMASLCYGIEKRKGFIVLTGEVGTGKTLLVRWLMNALNRTKVKHSYLINPRLSSDDFLQYVLEDFGIGTADLTRSEMLLNFNSFLIGIYKNASTAVLLVDEAHLLSWEVLEDIRLLTNLETSQHKLLQIVLIGQPELDHRLDSVDMRQLKQRIAIRCSLDALKPEEVAAYIANRLKLAGYEGTDPIFTLAAVASIIHHSQGIPRVINTLCEGALISGFARQMKTIAASVIEEVAADYRLGVCETGVSRARSDDDEITPSISRRLDRLLRWFEGSRPEPLHVNRPVGGKSL